MPANDLPELPDAFLIPREAYIYGKRGEWAIILALGPFELKGKTVTTQVVLDSFPWDVDDAKQLAGTEYRYTASDREESNIEGSIYLSGAHNPVDVTRVSFGPADDTSVQVAIDADIDFDFEGGGFNNRSARFDCRLERRTPGRGITYRVIR